MSAAYDQEEEEETKHQLSLDQQQQQQQQIQMQQSMDYYGQGGGVLGVGAGQQQTNLAAVAAQYNELANTNPELAHLLQQEANKQAMYGMPMMGMPGGMYRMTPEMLTMAAAGAQVMEEEPLYVNAKQYNRILKRRQARAKLESQLRAHKAQDKAPYMHESRHRHAMKRPRGPGGRFLTAPEIAAMKAKEAAEAAKGITGETVVGEKTDSDSGSNGSQGNVREKIPL